MDPHAVCRDPEIAALIGELEQLRERIAAIDPICDYFIKMCKMALLENDQKKHGMH